MKHNGARPTEGLPVYLARTHYVRIFKTVFWNSALLYFEKERRKDADARNLPASSL